MARRKAGWPGSLQSSMGHSRGAAAASRVPALFVLGDSLVDDGNNGALARADYYPYGVDFPPLGAATGRFCNGKTVADALCQCRPVVSITFASTLPPACNPSVFRCFFNSFH